MKKYLKALVLLILSLSTSYAQVSKKMIVEHFTNTKCSICASRNPGFNTNLNANPQVQRISIHPSSPYATCYLSLQNTVENDARTNYYNVFGGTPKLVINGTAISTSQNYADAAMFNPFIAQSNFTISIQQFAVGQDSIRSEITVKRIAAGAPTGTASLFAGLVEDTVFGNGGNGESMHFNVLRRTLFSPQGQGINLPVNVGDSLVFTKTENFNNIWDTNRMRTVAILQDEVSKSVIQSELSSTNQQGNTTALKLYRMCNVQLFPNPAYQFVMVSLPETSACVNYALFNQYGQLIQTNKIYNGQKIPVAELANGIYFVHLSTENYTTTARIIVLH